MKRRTKLRRGQRGQALLLVTLSLFAMCGLLGLAVDLGWSYFVKKSAQNAADSAALADAYQALGAMGETGSFSAYADDQTSGLAYAQQNGFTPGGSGSRQNVTFTSNSGAQQLTRQDGTFVVPCAPAGPLVSCFEYGVTVRTAESIPQLFSAVLGNTTALSSARATAAVVEARVNGSVIALDRAVDAGPNPSGMIITSPSGLVVAASVAGVNQINGPIISLSPLANPGAGGSNTFHSLPDGPQFLDPLRGYGQPPLPNLSAGAHACNLADSGPECVYAVAGGVLSSTICLVQGRNAVSFLATRAPDGTIVLPSGTYFAVQTLFPTCNMPVQPIAGSLSTGPGTITTFANGSFGSFVFFGGLMVSGQMNLDPGEYVIVGGGSLQVNGGNAGIAIKGSAGAGEIFILTGSSSAFTSSSDNSTVTGNLNGDLYPGLLNLINGPTNTNQVLVQLAQMGAFNFGSASIQTSLGSDPTLAPTGLNPMILSTLSSPYPAGLQSFGGIVLWQDQANSTVKYTPDGNVACSGGITNPCPGNSTLSASQLTLPGTTLGLNGTIYQPRGASISVSSGSGLSGTLQLITGAVTGGGIMSLSPPTTVVPLRRRVVALIE